MHCVLKMKHERFAFFKTKGECTVFFKTHNVNALCF